MSGINNNPAPPEIVRNYNTMTQYGSIGQNKYAGVFYEEFEKDLVGRRGVEAYKEMSENDDVIGAILFAIEMLIRQTKFEVEPQGKGEVDKKAAEFIQSCLDDMQQSFQDTLSEMLSFLTYGWSYHEICYKRRMGKNQDQSLKSKYDDGLIGWQKIPIRAQETLWRWEYDEKDDLVGMTQMAPPHFQIQTIPSDKAMHLITKSRKWNPEGRSILRNAYRSYYFKKRMQEIEGIGVERDLAGLPVLIPPIEYDIWNTNDPDMVRNLTWANKLVQNVRRDAVEGLVIPHGWEFKLLNGGSRRQFEIGKVIERYDNRMAMTVLADFVLLGHQAVGSFALSSDKTELFSVAIGTYLNVICEAFNTQSIPKLIDLNGDKFKGIEDYPKMVHGDIEEGNLTEISTYLEKMIGVGLIVPDENLAQHARRIAKLPEATEGTAMLGEMDEEEDPRAITGEEKEPQAGNKNKPKVNPSNKVDAEVKEKLEKGW